MSAASTPESPSRRDELLAIASGLFAERGFKNTTVRDIADAAGILSGSLYHHFDSKESMVDEILRGFLDTLFERYHAIVTQDLGPRGTLEAIVVASFQA
ncbi:MAG: TetR/AcrR family transcriptional regulator, partial [Marmoricola sp.]